jgi:hypothetical protein
MEAARYFPNVGKYIEEYTVSLLRRQKSSYLVYIRSLKGQICSQYLADTLPERRQWRHELTAGRCPVYNRVVCLKLVCRCPRICRTH